MKTVKTPFTKQPRKPLSWRLWYAKERAVGGHPTVPRINSRMRVMSDTTLLELQDISWYYLSDPQRTRLDQEFERRGYFQRCDVCNDWVPDGRFGEHNNTHYVLHVILTERPTNAKRIIEQQATGR